MKKIKNLWVGIAGGFTAATCCIAPIVLVLLGFSTAFGMAIMHQFHLVSIISGILLMLLISLYLVKRESGVCNLNSIKQNWKGISITVVIMFVGWIIINYFAVGTVASVVYGGLGIDQKPLGNIKEMAESHGMPEMAEIEIIPENEGMKEIILEIEGTFCGSCGPAIEHDVKSILGVINVEKSGSEILVTYNSDITSKNIIVASIHDPYSAKIISEKIIENPLN